LSIYHSKPQEHSGPFGGHPLTTLDRLEAAEDVPSDIGSHHGKLFEVARITVSLDENSCQVIVTRLEKDVWNQ